MLADWDYRTASTKALAFVNILVISFTIVVVAVPEGRSLVIRCDTELGF